MIGQDRLIKLIDSFTIDNIPKSIIISGDNGSGKHMICNYIGNKLNLPVEEITDKFNQDLIEDIMLRTSPYLYIIDGNKLSVRDQNVLLKLLEEPLANSILVIIAQYAELLLPTIINRCQKWTMSTYSKQCLRTFVDDSYKGNLTSLLSVANTPGKVLFYQQFDIQKVCKTCDLILDNISKAAFSNVLSLDKRFTATNEKDKIDLSLFTDVFYKVAVDRAVENELDAQSFNVIRKWRSKCRLPHVNQKVLFDNFIIDLWTSMRSKK